MSEVTLTAIVDESHILHLELPPDMIGEVEVVVRDRIQERPFRANGPAVLEALRNAPRSTDPSIWQESRKELARMRDEWDED